MIDTKQALTDLELTMEQYEERLSRYTEDELHRQPSPGAWSVGQVYTHLLNTAFHMQLKAIDVCREGGAAGASGKSEAGEGIFRLGSFPPTKIAVPASDAYTPPNTEDAASIRARLQELKERLRDIEPQLAAIPADRVAVHPRLGGLNATEWFALLEMHFRHHLRQLGELETFLGKSA
ncbi:MULTISPECIES: DinB family protein [Paenibacillus]|uniref:DinB family protein n=1 Tax=Paenibacillus TaxID=44249 RepID=UPI0022B8FE92|nr:DinB family protein [Paenibacillus caseinilyticus]MCZ8519668.1 DinB family protein [Paenibacillus caseinilyticus]